MRTPIKRSKETLDALQLQLVSLPCFEEHPGDVSPSLATKFLKNTVLYFVNFEEHFFAVLICLTNSVLLTLF